MDDPADAQIARRLHDVERALDVGVDVGIGRVIGIGNGDQRRQMQHGIATLHGRAHAVGIADVAGEHLELAAARPRRSGRASPRN